MTALVFQTKGRDIEKTVEYFTSKGIEWHAISPLPLRMNKKVMETSENYCVKDESFENSELLNFMYNRTYNQCLGRKIGVDLSGNVKPCLKSQAILGNIFEDSFKDILLTCNHEKYWFLSKDKVNVCKDCEFRYGCSHDCPVAAKNLKGRVDSQYPFCLYDPYTGRWGNCSEIKTE
jgi:radical SAM protein with 4Fe4S-binding SPASM domain